MPPTAQADAQESGSVACPPWSLHNRDASHHFAFDQEYIDRLTRGDPEVEQHFTTYFNQLLLVKLRSRLSCPQLAADARQETFVRVLHALRRKGTILFPERLGAFVNGVCDNVLLEFYRSGSRTAQLPETGEPEDPSISTESELITDERKRLVKQTLAQMSTADQTLLREVFLEEKDRDEICREMRIDRGYLRVRVHRALTRFRASFTDDGPKTTIRTGGLR